jgi:hypothetical protein
MTERSSKPVFSRPPVDSTPEEIDAWARSFVAAMLGPSIYRDLVAYQVPGEF